MTTPMSLLKPGAPDWWVSRLHRELSHRRPALDFFDAYYRGDHPLPWLAEQAQDEFRRLLAMTRSNYMGLVVDSKAERIQVEGFRVAGSEVADAEMWRVWQANDLDSDSDQAFLEALIGGRSFLMVAPNPKDQATPIVTVEHASQTIVAYKAGTNRREVAAALKVWQDEWTGELHSTLYLPEGLYKLKAPARRDGETAPPVWTQREDDAPNPLRVVPIVELENTPRLLSGGRSMLTDLTDIQDRINKTIADRLMTQDFGAFPQKWAVGYPLFDEDGNAQPKIEAGRDRMVTTDLDNVSFGQWESAPLDPYSAAKREDVKDIASRSRTPAQYLLGEMSNVNGETLKASESGHIAVVRQMCRHFGDGLERAARMIQLVAGETPDPSMETIWANPEFRTQGELTDATIKKVQGGLISKRQAREDLGYTTTQIGRIEQELIREASQAGLGDLTTLFGERTPA